MYISVDRNMVHYYKLQEVELEDRTNFTLINHKTACPTVLSLLLSQIDRELDDTEWVVTRMRSQLATLDTGRNSGKKTLGSHHRGHR